MSLQSALGELSQRPYRGGKNYVRGTYVASQRHEDRLPPFRGYDAEPGLRDLCLRVADGLMEDEDFRRLETEQARGSGK